MATYIKDLKEDNGDIVYPHTNTDAVYTTTNETLETRISKYVTAEDIASSVQSFGTVTSGMLDDDAVTTAKIDDEAVTTAKIDDGAVTNAKLASNAVASSNIDWSTIEGDQFISHTTTGGSFTLPAGYKVFRVVGKVDFSTSSSASGIWMLISNRKGTDWCRRLLLESNTPSFGEWSYTDGHLLLTSSQTGTGTSAGSITFNITMKIFSNLCKLHQLHKHKRNIIFQHFLLVKVIPLCFRLNTVF